MPSLVDQFRQQWAPFQDTHRVLVACSGGPDSVALLLLLQQTHRVPGELVVAHFHHRLRGRSSDDDAQFVSELSQRLRLACHVGHADAALLARQSRGQGLEAAARRQRYRFLTATAEHLGARYVAVGHTADDQAETVLHHVLRGSGLAGLAGIRTARVLSPAVTLVRPLLNVSRAEVLDFLHAEGQSFREDEHNREPRFLRSRIRNQLLPLLEADFYPDVRRSLRRLARVARDAQRIIEPLAESLLDDCLVQRSDDTAELDCRPLASAAEHLCREAFVCLWRRQAWPQQSMTFEHWQQLADMARAAEPRPPIHLPGAIRACREDGKLSVTSKRGDRGAE
jgi:tRNA(Ile)-lysidine synthase